MSDQVYLKCVSTENDYLTVGKVYVADVDPTGGYWLVDDDRQRGFQWKLSGSHGNFEIVKDFRKEPKLTPRSLGCFREVADVIGEDAAEVELQKVLGSSSVEWMEGVHASNLVDAFIWSSSPQKQEFWDAIDDGDIPEGYQTNHHQISTNGDNSSDNSNPKSTPEFGDVLHIRGQPRVYLRGYGNADAHKVVSEDGQIHIVDLHEFDEYAPDPTQELRNQVLKDWQQQSLDNSFDTEVCRVDMSVGDIIDFILENGYRKSEDSS